MRANRPGPRPFVPTAEQRKVVQNCVSFGFTEEQTVTLIINPHNGRPISLDTLQRRFKKELADGLPKANAQVAGALFAAAMAGHVGAQIFWLKTRAGWREVQYVQIVPTPGEMTTEELDEAIERAQADIRAREAAGSNVASLNAYRKTGPPTS